MTGLSAAAFLITGSFVMLGGMEGLAKLVSAGSLGNFTETDGYPLIDNVIRFSGALMFSVGLGFIYCFSDVQNKTVLFRFLLLAVFLGGLARLFGWSQSGFVSATIPSTATELVFPPVMYFLQSRLTTDT
jgi:hypothetical protein